MKNSITRREFIARACAGTAGIICLPGVIRAQVLQPDAKPALYVIHGKNIAGMLAAGIARMGGWKSFVKPGGRVVLKVNAAWASSPEEGGNTNPALAEECIRQCRLNGAREVLLPEKTCSPAKESFRRSGLAAAAEKSGGKLYAPAPRDFRRVKISKGVSLKEIEAVGEVLDAECLINMPVAKSHGGAGLTISMKNWMGSVNDRGFWHRNNLHQCIADCSTLIKPKLIIVDATRILLTNGPRGPGKLAYPDQIIFGTDPVAVDAYAATLFKKEPFSIRHIKIAHEMGIGCGDLSQVRIEHGNV
ncbi:MAG: DUF362 domain-containing protein [Kiritimatiellae bacterium]|jgi:uncharacterized protein (DUF362 family)|nr:DUF362 domain-containing protein [Kiritimatiellia bacterium]